MRTASRNFFLFSGQTTKPSAWAQNRSNRPGPSRFGDQLFGLIRPFHSRRETIGPLGGGVKLGFRRNRVIQENALKAISAWVLEQKAQNQTNSTAAKSRLPLRKSAYFPHKKSDF
jgi:hypothetical protein